MPDVLLGQSYFLRFDQKLWQAMQPYPPLGALYAASCLRDRGIGVDVFDAMLSHSTDDWKKQLGRSHPRFAVIFEDNFNYLTKMCLLRMREAAFEMIASAKAFGCQVIVGGSDATDHSGDYLARGADFVLIGEGEIALAELVESLLGRSSAEPHEIPGVVSRKPATKKRKRENLRNLDALSFPAWDLVELDRYRRIWLRRHGYFSINLATTRGCPYQCNWCAKPIWGQRYNSRSPENVVQEMLLLKGLARPDHIWFVDDIFGLKKGWIDEFAELVAEYGVRTPFKCLLRADQVTRQLALALSDSGCQTAWIGAESGSQKILDAMEKGTTVEQIYRATALLRQRDIRVAYFLQFGYPGEEWSDIQLTLKMVWDNLPDDIGVSVSYPLPGTRFYENVRSELGLRRNWVDSDDLAMLFQGRYCPEFYRQLHRVLHKKYRARRAWQQIVAGKRFPVIPLARALSLPLDEVRLYRLRSLHRPAR